MLKLFFLASLLLPIVANAVTIYQPTKDLQPWDDCRVPVYAVDYTGPKAAALDAMRVIERAGYTVDEIDAPYADRPFVRLRDSASDIGAAEPYRTTRPPWGRRIWIATRQHSRWRENIEHETCHLVGCAHDHQNRSWSLHIPTDYNAARWPIRQLLPLPVHLDDAVPANPADLVRSNLAYFYPAVFDYTAAGFDDLQRPTGLTAADLDAIGDLCERWTTDPAALIAENRPRPTPSARYIRWNPDDDRVRFELPGGPDVFGEATGGVIGPRTVWAGALLAELAAADPAGWRYDADRRLWRVVVPISAIADVLGVGIGTGAWLRWYGLDDDSDPHAPGVFSAYLRIERDRLPGAPANSPLRLLLRQQSAFLPEANPL